MGDATAKPKAKKNRVRSHLSEGFENTGRSEATNTAAQDTPTKIVKR